MISNHPLTFQHWAGISPYTSPYGFAETCVFDKQSRKPGFCESGYSPDRTFSRSYGTILPSSLERVISRGLAYSACPPVSVCSTIACPNTQSFSRQRGVTQYSRIYFGIRNPISAMGYPSASLWLTKQAVTEY